MTTIPVSLWDQLAEASAKINHATDEIARSIAVINLRLSDLNIGVPAWYYFEPGDEEYKRIGYAKLGCHWGLLIGCKENEWHFNDAPRVLRLEAINYIPNLLQRMTDETVDITGLIEAKLLRMKGSR